MDKTLIRKKSKKNTVLPLLICNNALGGWHTLEQHFMCTETYFDPRKRGIINIIS